ncbi:hypothetical protein ElyMa_000051700 [Elysia marginata]|uniref:ISXO2-like transposase domain-containing protein n=1 Tax=Elysia marginata TaxID=1093978 RepID=A0AAV4EFL8_9GAST|nr:hypothetical protein ElyMa_000051700 [Elysia marginata]
MAGRILQLVDLAIILTNPELRAEEINFTDLNLGIVDNLDMLQWATRRRLLRNSVLWATCNQPASLNTYAQGVDGYRWRCNAHNFTMSVVEIDKSLFFRRKYERGNIRPAHWVFGANKRDSGNCFMVEVPNRNRATLEPIIRQFILPGTHIISDGWAAYANTPNIGGGIYTHEVIIHEDHFVDPDDDSAHTQNIEKGN